MRARVSAALAILVLAGCGGGNHPAADAAYGDNCWLINPMFFDPLGMSPPYPCATKGFDEPNGDQAPLRRPDSSVVPDQQDRVY